MTTKAETAAAAAACEAAHEAHRRAIADLVAAGNREGMAIELGVSKRKLAQLEKAFKLAEEREAAADKAHQAALAAYHRAMSDEVAA